MILAAGDTFRAAAVEQLQIWGERADCLVLTRPTGSDAAGLAYDALVRAREEDADLLLIDTAGRLHNKADLMGELQKIVRVLRKVDPQAPHAVLLVLDATTGQNGLAQAREFLKAGGVDALVLTKLDGTAKGGVVCAIALAQSKGTLAQSREALAQSGGTLARFKDSHQRPIPLRFVGVGEGIDDLRPFVAAEFAEALID